MPSLRLSQAYKGHLLYNFCTGGTENTGCTANGRTICCVANKQAVYIIALLARTVFEVALLI